MPNRHGSSNSYRYGFQGQEKDDELKGEGNSLNYTFRMHDPRVGRFFAVDPLTSKYPHYTPYSFSGNKVIRFVELEGLEEADPTGFDGWTHVGDKSSPAIQDVPKEEMTKRNVMFSVVVLSPLVVAAAPEIAGAYSSYSSWFGTTQLSNYLTTNSVIQTSFSAGAINGTTNFMGQMYSNDFKFDENINLAQPFFAATFSNPLFSNFGESSVNVYYKDGLKYEINDSVTFVSTFFSNFVGSKVNNKLEVNTGYKPADNVLNTTTGTGVEVMENTIGNKTKDVLKSFKSKKQFKKEPVRNEKVKDEVSSGSTGKIRTDLIKIKS